MGINLVRTQRGALAWWKFIFLLKEEESKMYLTVLTIVLSLVPVLGRDGKVAGCFSLT